MSKVLPQVVIIGRPNVGKSTLFNRLVGRKLALVDDQPGVTRDRRIGDVSLSGMRFQIIDTAGWEDEGIIRPGARAAFTLWDRVGGNAQALVL